MITQIESIDRLVNYFRSLPGVGLKTAQRYAYKIINSDAEFADEFANAILDCKKRVHFCNECGYYIDGDECMLCKNRNMDIICVVKDPKDVESIEKAKSYNFAYHVLHGTLAPLEGKGPDDIRIKELLERVAKHNTKEVIIATNPDVEGDATAMYISKLLSPLGVKVTRLAQGISIGSEIEYADEVTLTRAIEARREI